MAKTACFMPVDRYPALPACAIDGRYGSPFPEKHFVMVVPAVLATRLIAQTRGDLLWAHNAY